MLNAQVFSHCIVWTSELSQSQRGTERDCTCVVVSSWGILESVALRHSTVSLPPFHLQVQCWGQWPRVEDSWTQNSSMEWELCRQNYTDWTREFLHSFKKDGHLLMQNMLYSARLKEPQGTTATERASCEVEVKYFSLFYLLCQCHLVEVELCEVCKVWPRTNTN